ncbi:thiazolylpeptide-type bacteriocin [Bacillus cereus]|uniref:thiazolylpeptide-type bacteriocin n=2 Tax=Bacillus cereus TaxID=1396 RepID=UPI001C3F4483|nr:thiazolylpeptide-type bacteriocin [Bacillus cereus]
MNKEMQNQANAIDFLELGDVEVLDVEGSLGMPETGASSAPVSWLCCSSSSSCCS